MKTLSIPVPVVKFLMLFNKGSLAEAMSYFIKSLDGDSYYFTDLLVEDGVLTEELGNELFSVSKSLKYEDVFEWYAALKEETNE